MTFIGDSDRRAPLGGYDVVGDIHGCADLLVQLMERLGYSEQRGVWRHPTRTMVFLGDFIDRGPTQIDAVRIPMQMVRAGSAVAVAGNHEFNAVAYATPHPGGGWCRPHSAKNSKQHAAFIEAVGFGSDLHMEIVDWFRTLPVALDLDGLRAVHACWHDTHIGLLEAALGGDGMTDEFIVRATETGSPLDTAVEVVLKGPEAELAGYSYLDKDGHPRRHGRIEWWRPGAATLRAAVRIAPDWPIVGPDGSPAAQLPDAPVSRDLRGLGSGAGDPVTFFGHYWFDPVADQGPRLLESAVTCLDWSAVKGGAMVAYRWSGESQLDPANLVWVAAA